jgi:hypothetical protein
LTIAVGIVAENSIVWRSGPVTGLDQAFDVGQEAHVEHLVGLVEDQLGDVRQVEVAPVEVVEQPPGRADHDVDAAAQGLDLLVVADPAVDADRGEPERAPIRGPRGPAGTARGSAR